MGNSPSFAGCSTQEIAVAAIWAEGLSSFGAMAKRQMESLVSTIKCGVLDRIILSAGNQLAGIVSEDKAYLSLEKMAGCYKAASAIYRAEREGIGTYSIRSLMDEINSFMEGKAESLSVFEDGINPVAMERTKIIGLQSSSFLASFDEIERGCAQEEALLRASLKREAAFDPQKACEREAFLKFMDALKESVTKHFMQDCYDASIESVKCCVNQLMDPENRKEAENFRLMLEAEHRQANGLLLMKIERLSSELERNAGNSKEQDSARKLLNALREGCECFKEQAEDALSLFARSYANSDEKRAESPSQNDGAIVKLDTPEEFEAAFLEMFSNCALLAENQYFDAAKALSVCSDKVKSFFQESKPFFEGRIFRAVLSKLLKSPLRANADDFANELFEQAKAEAVMSEEIVAVFAKLISFYRERFAEYDNLPENDIMKGINETLIIKIESLTENTAAFMEKAKLLSSKAQTLSSSLNHEESDALVCGISQQFRQLFTPVPESPEVIASLYDTLYKKCAGSEALEGFAGRLSAELERHRSSMGKAIAGFRKEILLFEVSTFEEILQYSVSRLKESTFEPVLDYVQSIHEGASAIEIILQRRGIKLIKPSPHEMFNGREHEVLVVEKNGDFSKGEIIKLMTSGYKQDGNVLMRANVIAAR